VRQVGGDLDAGEAVASVTVVIELGELVERTTDVGQHHRPVVVERAAVALGQLAELLVVVGRTLNRLLEDGRVAGETADAFVHQMAQLTGGEVPTLQVVEPRALPELVVQASETIHDYPFAAANRVAAATTLSTLIPSLSMTTLPGALAPNRSMPIDSSA
jgi:hypothetical protein